MDKQRKLDYYQGVIENMRSQAENCEMRLEKAKEIGANKKTHKHYKEYKKIKDDLKRYRDYEKNYIESWEKEAGREYDGKRQTNRPPALT